MSVASEAFSEILAVGFAKRSYQRVIAFSAKLAVLISASFIQPVIAVVVVVVVTHKASKSYEQPLVLPQLMQR